MKVYEVGEQTMEEIFRKNNIINVSNWQLVLDAVENKLLKVSKLEKFLVQKCKKCNGVGKVSDAEPGYIQYREFLCTDCCGEGEVLPIEIRELLK